MKRVGKKLVALVAVALMAMTMMVGCASVDNSAVVATVGDSEITAGMAAFYLRYQQSSMETYSQYYGEDFWNQDLTGTGTLFKDTVKDTVMETLQQLYILEDHMGDYEVSLTEDELAKIEEVAAEFDKENSADVKDKVSADKETVAEFLKLITIYDKMYAAIIADVDTNVSDDEAAQKRMRYASFSTVISTEDGTTSKMTDDQAATIKSQAEDFLAAAKTVGNLEGYASGAGVETQTLTFDAESTDIDAAVIEAADKLKEGEFSGVIETENGYFVVQLESEFDKEATETEKGNIIAERESALYTEVYEGWKEATDIKVHENVWKKLDITSLLVTATGTETEETGTTE